MNKDFTNYKGNEYIVRNVDLSIILDGYNNVNVSEMGMLDAFDLTDKEAEAIDRTIYCYFDEDFLDTDPTDTEILLAIIRQEGEDTESWNWRNLLYKAQMDLVGMYNAKQTNIYTEMRKNSNGEITIYLCNNTLRNVLYKGNSQQDAAITIVNVLTTIRLMKHTC